jgi:hypothetical protein
VNALLILFLFIIFEVSMAVMLHVVVFCFRILYILVNIKFPEENTTSIFTLLNLFYGSSLFWDVAQRRLVVNRRFGTTYRSQLKESCSPLDSMTLALAYLR